MNIKWSTLLTLLIFIGFINFISLCSTSNLLRNFDIEANEPINRQLIPSEEPPRIPRIQLEAGKAINLALLTVPFLWKCDGILPKIPLTISFLVIFQCLQLFFGYKVQLTKSDLKNDNILVRLPKIDLIKMNFLNVKEFVYFEQWLFTPLSWFIQILLSLPSETYQNLYLNYGFPEYKILTAFFVILLINMCGVFHPSMKH